MKYMKCGHSNKRRYVLRGKKNRYACRGCRNGKPADAPEFCHEQTLEDIGAFRTNLSNLNTLMMDFYEKAVLTALTQPFPMPFVLPKEWPK